MEDLLNVRDKRFLITGAASGIGKATAQILANLGAELILVDCNKEGLTQFIEQQAFGKLHPLVLDLNEPNLIKPGIESVVNQYGKLHGIAHIAGIPYITPLKALNRERADKLYRVNQYAAIELIKAFSSNKISNRGGVSSPHFIGLRDRRFGCKCCLRDDQSSDNRYHESIVD